MEKTQGKENKKPVTVRLESDVYDFLKEKSSNGTISQAQIIEDAVRNSSNNDSEHLNVQLDIKDQQIAFLENSIEKLTGKKPKRIKRISIPVSIEEFVLINKQSHTHQLPKTDFLRMKIFGVKPKLQLSPISPKIPKLIDKTVV